MSSFLFPSPVGGTPDSIDTAPTVLFMAVYVCLLPLILYRGISRESRTVILFGVMFGGIHRIADTAVRVREAVVPSDRFNESLIRYLQTSYGAGWIATGHSLMELFRCLLLNAVQDAYPQFYRMDRDNNIEMQPPSGSMDGEDSSKDIDGKKASGEVIEVPQLETNRAADTPFSRTGSLSSLQAPNAEARRLQKKIWCFHVLASLPFIMSVILAIAAGASYYNTMSSHTAATSVMALRATSAVLALGFIQVVNVACFTMLCIRRIPRKPALLICALAMVLSITPVYRLIVMRCQTDALESTAPCSLNGRSSKVMFYVFHMVPEFLCLIALMSINTRRLFRSGLWGLGER